MSLDLTSLITGEDLLPVVVKDTSILSVLRLLNAHVKQQQTQLRELEEKLSTVMRRSDYDRDYRSLLVRIERAEETMTAAVSKVQVLSGEVRGLQNHLDLTMTERLDETLMSMQMQIRGATGTIAESLESVCNGMGTLKTRLDELEQSSHTAHARLTSSLSTVVSNMDALKAEVFVVAEQAGRGASVVSDEDREPPSSDEEPPSPRPIVQATVPAHQEDPVDQLRRRVDGLQEELRRSLDSMRSDLRRVEAQAANQEFRPVAEANSEEGGAQEVQGRPSLSLVLSTGGRARTPRRKEEKDREGEIIPEVKPPEIDIPAIVDQLRGELALPEIRGAFEQFSAEHAEAMSALERKIDRDYVERLFSKFREVVHGINNRVRELGVLLQEYATKEDVEVLARVLERVPNDVKSGCAVKRGTSCLFCGRPRTTLRGQISPRTAAAAGAPPVRGVASEFPGPDFVYGDGEAFKRDEVPFPPLNTRARSVTSGTSGGSS
jgi:hypothetical protein